MTSHRADIIGVSVKLTSSDTMMANAIVRPKLFMKRPTMPLMNPTGTKIATSEDGESDFTRALHRRFHGRHPLFFDEPVDVLQHDNRIVDDDTDGERQRQH